MLSILIPTYNYTIFPMVQELHKQATLTGIAFEIICLDDASGNQQHIAENQKINQLDNCSYTILDKNIGRSSIRNLLAQKANYKWLLFLDADTFPAGSDFISRYIPHLDNEEKVVSGGILYQEQKPDKTEILRWVYGNKREALPQQVRAKAPYISLLTLNFLISKSIFDKVRFNETIPNLRHEDTLFSYDLSQKKVKVMHIDNPVYHLGLETSTFFIKKSEEAIDGLVYFLDHGLIDKNYIRISKLYFKLEAAGLAPVVAYFHAVTKKIFKAHLLGSNPSLFIFDLYRLGYLCSLKK